MKKLSVFILFVVMSFSANAGTGNAWYWGKVDRILTVGSDGSFQVFLENDTVKSFCAYDTIMFNVSDMGAERTKAALSMALSAFAAGHLWGVVIDMPTSEANCVASPTATQGAGIRAAS